MDRSLAKWFSVYSCLNLSYNGRDLHKSPEPAPDTSELKQVLDEIFSVDPVTGFPKGDIQYYLSSDGNPMVKQWLETHLLKPRQSSGQSLQGLTDDMIVEFSRGKGESIEDYQARLTSLYDSAKAEYESLNVPPQTE